MLIIPLYHRVGSGKYANSSERFRSHFLWIARNAKVLLPGEKLEKGLNLLLTFDDATVDFYVHIYPLLREFKLRALLSVPTFWIEKSTIRPMQERLCFCDPFTSKDHFCTVAELREMQDSGFVELACHSHFHRDLTLLSPDDLEEELAHSRNFFSTHFSSLPATFVYPFGKTSRLLRKRIQEEYPLTLRIGNALNFSWTPLLYRISCDRLENDFIRITSHQFLKWLANRVRAK